VLSNLQYTVELAYVLNNIRSSSTLQYLNVLNYWQTKMKTGGFSFQ